MTQPLQIPLATIPFLNRDGTVHSIWRAFLDALVNRESVPAEQPNNASPETT